ncbi:hypothetical protein DPMN_110783 [Dreissena polymorpha]|uniref:Uncharacterized protein n=1 Tax=Dreissena polymorpha TaxID=45954 RepID=A0A9D4KDG2_DREPO|nr:hypothetical protein DPMN_110783 [Dreissena polymorpha]
MADAGRRKDTTRYNELAMTIPQIKKPTARNFIQKIVASILDSHEYANNVELFADKNNDLTVHIHDTNTAPSSLFTDNFDIDSDQNIVLNINVNNKHFVIDQEIEPLQKNVFTVKDIKNVNVNGHEDNSAVDFITEDHENILHSISANEDRLVAEKETELIRSNDNVNNIIENENVNADNNATLLANLLTDESQLEVGDTAVNHEHILPENSEPRIENVKENLCPGQRMKGRLRPIWSRIYNFER